MKLRVFHSDKGDCLLVRGSGGGRILSDGGMRESFVAHVAKHLTREDPLDLVCISHVDDDHIGGILELLDNAMAWKVFDHHHANGDDDFNEPDVPRMPQIKRMWHNAFHDQIGENAGEIADMLAAMVPLLADVDDAALRAAASENESIVTSNKQANPGVAAPPARAAQHSPQSGRQADHGPRRATQVRLRQSVRPDHG